MRVLLVGLRWPTETFLARKIEILQRAGVKLLVAAKVHDKSIPVPDGVQLINLPQWRGSLLRRCLNLGVSLVRAVFRSPVSTARVFAAVAKTSKDSRNMFVWLYRLLPFSGIKTDIIHFEWNFAAVEFFPLFDLFNCPAVVSCRGAHVQVAPFNPQRESYVSGMRRSFERASAVHCVSEMIQREAQEYGLDPEKAFVIRPAVDPSFFYPAPRGSVPQKYFHIVTTGSLIWRKGYEYALIAIRRLIDRGIKVRFDLIGDGPKSEMQRLLFAIDDLELQSAVFLMGALQPEEVRTRLQESHAFLLSSLSEGISNSVLEAMACGLPVVTTNCGGMAEAITDGVEGFLVPVRDPAAMADRLERLASDVGLQRRMGEAARARVIKEFSLTAQGERYVDIYRGLLAKARSAVERTVVEQRP